MGDAMKRAEVIVADQTASAIRREQTRAAAESQREALRAAASEVIDADEAIAASEPGAEMHWNEAMAALHAAVKEQAPMTQHDPPPFIRLALKDDAEVERWYAAFEKVSGREAKHIEGKWAIYSDFAAEYRRLAEETHQ